MTDLNVKLQDCEVCAVNKAKYTCPKCEVRTCSLTCANIHKKELECDGIRDKTKYIPLKSFTDLDLLNDYRFLEDVGRSVDQMRRDLSKRFTTHNNLPLRLQKMKSAAIQRKTHLLFMPSNFKRHKENTTFFKWKTNELFWRIEWMFPQAENTKWVTERALESTRISKLLEQILDPIDCTSKDDEMDDADMNVKFSLKERLKFYNSVGLCGLKVLLKAEQTEKSDSRFYELDLTLTLRENFENKIIIEYPTLFVVLKDVSNIYDILDSDEETQNYKLHDTTQRNYEPKRKRQSKLNNLTKQKTSVNFFFNDEFSDSEDEMNEMSHPTKSKSSNFSLPDYNTLVKMEN